MIHVLITVKESERFPGKNRFLAPYTITWLLNEIAYIKEDVTVHTVGRRSELPLRLPHSWLHINTECVSHLEDIEYAEKQISPKEGDVMVLAQVTQPVREPFLLEQCIDCIRRGHKSCITVANLDSSSWRTVIDTRWNKKTEESELKISGQLYAWRPGFCKDIFDPHSDHGIVFTNSSWGLIDIDKREQVPPALSAICADTLYGRGYQSPITISGRTILIIGSGKDLVGRNLGSAIDSGKWDIVVRLNHYYGSVVDVGTRTDIAVVREFRFEKTFIDEAPVCPSHVIVTNEGLHVSDEIRSAAGTETGQRDASIGVITALWLMSQNPASIDVIGIGHYPDGSWIKQKTYPDGTIDDKGYYDWNKENAWWESRKNVIGLL